MADTTNSDHRYDAVVVGSGMGGAFVARELSRAGKDVLVLEAGQLETSVGTFKDTLRYYDGARVSRSPRKSKEGVILWRTFMAGGSTVVACGNGVRCLERQLSERGIDLAEEFSALEAELGVHPLEERLISEGGQAIRSAASELGLTFQQMPKFVDAEKCTACGKCAMGCASHAKWTAEVPLADAVAHGAHVVYGVEVDRVLRDNGHAVGVAGLSGRKSFEARADTVVLSAGGLGTPPILQHSGIDAAGPGLFIDTLVNVYGESPDLNLIHEPQMSLVDVEFCEERGFLLSPFVNHPTAVRAIEAGASGMSMPDKHLLGIMIKSRDDPAGQVFADGTVSKPVTQADQRRLDDGAALAREILLKAGADPKSIIVSKPQGAHHGGTAAIGTVVDENLQTDVEGLFVCDASVLPEGPGLPPMLTIGALALRLGHTLATA